MLKHKHGSLCINDWIKTCFHFQKLVSDNMDVLVQMRANFDKPEAMIDLQKKLTGTITVHSFPLY